MNRRLAFVLWVMLCFVLTNIAPVTAQGDSYLDTIYRAGNAGTAVTGEDSQVNYAGDDNQIPEVVDVPDPVGDPQQQKAIEKLQSVINSLMRIIAGRMCGTRIIVVVIPCERLFPKPPVPTATATSTSTSTSTGTSTSTATATSTSTSTSTATTTSTSTATATSTSTSTATATNTSTSTATATSTSTSTATATGTDKESIRAAVKAKYNISLTDGTNGCSWSENQLKAADEAFGELPAFFRGCTDAVYRDGQPNASFIPASALAYVMVPQRKVHMLDLSVSMTQGAYNSMVAAYGRAPTQAEQMAYLKHNFKRTLVHEMTHCFQNTYPQVYQSWASRFWPGGRLTGTCPTGYGRTQPAEDMAESVATYYTGGSIRNGVFVSRSGATMDMNRYNFIKQYVMNGKEYLY